MADAENPADTKAHDIVSVNDEDDGTAKAEEQSSQTNNTSDSGAVVVASKVDTVKAATSLVFATATGKAPFAFRSIAQVYGSRLIPIITTILLMVLSDDWKKEVDLPIWYRIALFAHATYFIVATDTYEIYGDAMGIMETQNVHYRMPRDNVTWFDKFVIGDLMFCCAVYYISIGVQTSVPVFALFLPIIQCSYNFRNDLMWMIGSMSPEDPKPRFPFFAITDAMNIWTFGIVYVTHFIMEAR